MEKALAAVLQESSDTETDWAKSFFLHPDLSHNYLKPIAGIAPFW